LTNQSRVAWSKGVTSGGGTIPRTKLPQPCGRESSTTVPPGITAAPPLIGQGLLSLYFMLHSICLIAADFSASLAASDPQECSQSFPSTIVG
jgi:hypothetical protein